MRKIFFYLLLFACASSIVSCNSLSTKAEMIFTTIGLNGNKVPSNFKRAFDEIRGQKRIGNLKVYSETEKKYVPATAQEYIALNYQNMFEEDIKKTKELTADDESQPIIDAGLAMFQYADEIYKNEYPIIAKMIDDGAPDEEVNGIIAELEATKGAELERLRAKTMDLLLPYANKNKVEYKTLNTIGGKRTALQEATIHAMATPILMNQMQQNQNLDSNQIMADHRFREKKENKYKAKLAAEHAVEFADDIVS